VGRVAIERVVFVDHVEKPLGMGGKSEGLDKVFEREPKMGRLHTEIWLDDSTMPALIVLQHAQSGEEECVPVTQVKSMRTVKSRADARKYREDAAKAKAEAGQAVTSAVKRAS
jgi:hypothetical protein